MTDLSADAFALASSRGAVVAVAAVPFASAWAWALRSMWASNVASEQVREARELQQRPGFPPESQRALRQVPDPRRRSRAREVQPGQSALLQPTTSGRARSTPSRSRR